MPSRCSGAASAPVAAFSAAMADPHQTAVAAAVSARAAFAGRIVVPKALREELGLTPGSTVDISRYGFGLQVVPGGRSGHLEVVDGRLVLTGEGEIDNEDVLRLVDAGRR